jgi:DNA-nicking Smr family endonuclease
MRRGKRQDPAPTRSIAGFHHHPFRQLATPKGARRAADVNPPPPASVAEPPAPAVTDEELFQREMAGVRRLRAAGSRVVPTPPAAAQRPVTDPDAEALAELSDLVTGSGPFDVADSVECVEGAVIGLDRRLVRRLRGGDFAYQNHIDLHGMTAEEARVAVDQFLARAHQRGERCVLIIHGRGRNSKDQVPVLKTRLATWLARGPWSRLVLAFTSARPCDGGVGALYVLLRRQRRGKQTIRVTHGAKW